MKQTGIKSKLWILLAIVLLFVIANFVISNNRILHSTDSEMIRVMDCEPVINLEKTTTYLISCDIKAEKSGKVEVLMKSNDHSIPHYTIPELIYIDATEEYQHFERQVQIEEINRDCCETYLSFFGTYGTGVFPYVKNVSFTPVY